MSWVIWAIIGIALIVVPTTIFLVVTTVRKRKSKPNADVFAELENLKNKGLITEQEYNEKRAEILNRGGNK